MCLDLEMDDHMLGFFGPDTADAAEHLLIAFVERGDNHLRPELLQKRHRKLGANPRTIGHEIKNGPLKGREKAKKMWPRLLIPDKLRVECDLTASHNATNPRH